MPFNYALFDVFPILRDFRYPYFSAPPDRSSFSITSGAPSSSLSKFFDAISSFLLMFLVCWIVIHYQDKVNPAGGLSTTLPWLWRPYRTIAMMVHWLHRWFLGRYGFECFDLKSSTIECGGVVIGAHIHNPVLTNHIFCQVRMSIMPQMRIALPSYRLIEGYLGGLRHVV